MVFRRRKLTDRVQTLIDEMLHLLTHESMNGCDSHGLRPVHVIRLEDRVLMSASPMAMVADAVTVSAHSMDLSTGVDTASETGSVDAATELAVSANSEDPGVTECDSTTSANGRTFEADAAPGPELIVIDYRVTDSDTLLEHLLETDRDVRFLRLDANEEGLKQITEKLDQLENVSAIHLLTHGRSGEILLGSTRLNAETLPQFAPELLAWQHSLTANADLLLYGCDVADSSEGQDFVAALVQLTKADVAASMNATGSNSFGGDWDLEYQAGAIETRVFGGSRITGDWNNLLGVITVNTTDDVLDGDTSSVSALLGNEGADGFISLREAIIATNNSTGADTIFLTAGTFTFSIGGQSENAAFSGDLDITDTLTITGAGSGLSIIDADALDRAFELRAGITATIEDVTIRGGVTAANGAGGGVLIDNGASLTLSRAVMTGNSAGSGAGIYNDGTLVATDTVIRNNTSSDSGAGLYNDRGNVTLNRVTISGNIAGKDGGGIVQTGSGAAMTLTNVTLSGNVALGDGGGLWASRSVSATNVTIAFNEAVSGDGVFQRGGGVDVSFRNSVLHNPDGTNANRALTSLGNNIDSDGTAVFAGVGDLVTNPQLAALADYGGATPTHALLAGSPAINSGTSAGAPSADQRGAGRLGVTDIGAYEYTEIAYESFNYAAGSFNGANGGIGWASAWSNAGFDTMIDTTGLHDPLAMMPVGGGTAELQNVLLLDNVTQSRNLTTVIGATSTTTWLSFLINPASTLPGDYIGLQFGNPAGPLAFAGYESNKFVLEQVDANSRVNVNGITPSVGQTYFLTVKMEFFAGLDTITLYVNPTPGLSSPDSTFTATRNDIDLGTFTQVSLSGGSLIGNLAALDELRIAGSYLDVAPVSLAPVNQTPMLTTTAGAIGYTENEAPMAIDSGLIVNDADGINLTSTMVAITGNYSNGQDVLAFADRPGITGIWDASTGVLILNGTATVADYQTALRSVTYVNNSDGPNTLSRTVTFVATDENSISAAATRNVTVTAVNDAPVITSGGGNSTAELSVNENTTSVTTVTASDVDVPNQTLTWSISGGTDAARFAINSSTGVLTFISPPDFETPTDAGSNNVYNVTVQVSDGAFTDTQSIAVAITPVNDNTPVITSNGGGDSATISIAENSTAVTRVTATDADLPAQTLTYSISGGADAARFLIDSTTGVLTFVSAPNAESPGDGGADNDYHVNVRASDGTRTDSQAITVTVTDVDEFNAGPVSDINASANAINENAANGTGVGITARATDLDITNNAITYTLDDNANGRFSIHAATGVVKVANPSLLDFESSTSHNIVVRAVSADGSSTTTDFSIGLLDVNEEPLIGNQAFSVAEDSPNGTVVGSVLASDVDAGTNGVLTYSISGGNGATAFAINAATGQITVSDSSQLDFETNTSRTVQVTVTDGGAPQLSSSATITVYILDVNEVPTMTAIANRTILEADNTGAIPFTVGDPETANGTLIVTAVSSNQSLIPDANLVIGGNGANRNIIVTPLVGQSGGPVTITVTVSDGTLQTQETFDVTVVPRVITVTTTADEDDGDTTSILTLFAAPGGAGISLREAIEATNNTVVGATPDQIILPSGLYLLGPQELESISDHLIITGGDTRTTIIDAQGDHRVWTIDNNNTVNMSGLTIQGGSAHNGGGAFVNGGATLNLTDVRMTGNHSTNSGGALHVHGTVNLNRVLLDNNTAPDGGALGFHGADGGFLTNVTISGNTATGDGGAIHTDSLIHITNSTIANNSAGTTGGISLAGGSVIIGNSILDNSGGNASAALISDGFNVDSDGTAILTGIGDQVANPLLNALANNGGPTDTHALSYGSPAIDPAGLNNAPAIDQRGAARDGTPDAGAVEARANLLLGPIDDGDLIANQVNENAAPGTVVGITASAIDPNPDDTVSFSLDDNAGERFAIDSGTGVVTVADGSLLDYENSTSHSITVRATSSDTSFSSRVFTIRLLPLNDTSPAITSNGGGTSATIDVVENSGAVTTVTAVDVDLPAQILNYSITGGADAGLFTINSSTGVLSFLTPPDFEVPTDDGSNNVCNVTVRVSDGTRFDTQALIVSITPANDNSPIITSSGGGASATISRAENITGVTTVRAFDADQPVQTLTYSIFGGADAARFTIDSATGVLVFVAAPNFEAPADAGANNVYDVIVRVSDGNGATDSQTFHVGVTNVDETPVSIPTAPVIVLEDSAAGAVNFATAFSDPEGAAMSFRISGITVATPLFQTFDFNTTTGVVSWSLLPNAFGTASIEIEASDPSGQFVRETLTLIVQAVDDAPTVDGRTFGATAGHVLQVTDPGLLSTASDVEGDTLSLVILQAPLHGTLISQANGAFTYRPDDGFVGSDSFRFAVSDGLLLSDPQTARVDIYAISTGNTGGTTAPSADSSGNGGSASSDPTLNIPAISTGPGNTGSPAQSPGSLSLNQTGDKSSDDNELIGAGTFLGIHNLDADSAWIGLTPALTEVSRISSSDKGSQRFGEHSAEPESFLAKSDFDTARALNEARHDAVYRQLLQDGQVWHQLDKFEDTLSQSTQMNSVVVGSVGVVGTGLSVGYLIWIVRFGTVLSGLLAQVPAWTMLDPLLVMDGHDRDEDQDQESIQTIVDQQQSRQAGASQAPAEESSVRETQDSRMEDRL